MGRQALRSVQLGSAALITALLFASGALCAAETASGPKKETKEEIEAREALAEEEAERDQLGKAIPTTFAGRLLLNPIDNSKPTPAVIGSFTIDKGPVYPVKLSDPGLLRLLATSNGKSISVYGKLRNQGKYLVISGLIPAAPVPKGFSKRGGF